jgi:hypothetical protein
MFFQDNILFCVVQKVFISQEKGKLVLKKIFNFYLIFCFLGLVCVLRIYDGIKRHKFGAQSKILGFLYNINIAGVKKN